MTIKGIEVGGTIYNNEDETARENATQASQTATEASQTATQASQTATQASQTATEAAQKADEMYEAFPSNASASNKLVTEDDTNSVTLTSTDSLAEWAGSAKGVVSAFVGASSKPSDIGYPFSEWGETMILCIGVGTRKALFAIDYSLPKQTVYTRMYYNGSFITDWAEIT